MDALELLTSFLRDIEYDSHGAIVNDCSRWPDIRCEFFANPSNREILLLLILSKQQGKGNASKMLRELCDWASEHRITLKLKPQPVESDYGNIAKHDLVKWYERYGFRQHDDEMIRTP